MVNKLNTLEWYCGMKSFSNYAYKLGHKTWTIDNNTEFNPDQCLDLSDYIDILPEVDIFWASVPCTTFSVASIGKHWHQENRSPKTDNAIKGLLLLDNTIKAISLSKPKRRFIENPRGMMRKVIDSIFFKYGITEYKRVTISYCQYGDTRQKPTDIWTNAFEYIPKPLCKRGDPCHVSAPRGSRTGTQGLKGAKERSVIPEKLFIEIFNQLKV